MPIATLHKFYVSLQAGISYITAIKQGNFIREEYSWGGSRFGYFEERKASTVGLPIELKAIFFLNKNIGITTMGYANLNSRISTAGVGLGVVFGKL